MALRALQRQREATRAKSTIWHWLNLLAEPVPHPTPCTTSRTEHNPNLCRAWLQGWGRFPELILMSTCLALACKHSPNSELTQHHALSLAFQPQLGKSTSTQTSSCQAEEKWCWKKSKPPSATIPKACETSAQSLPTVVVH